MHTRSSLAQDLARLGVMAGDALMVHAGLRSVGPVLGGADAIIAALRQAVGTDGTLLAYCDWQMPEDVPQHMRDEVIPFDANSSRSIRDNGAFPELLRTTPGARRSGSPGASCAALGAKADWLTADHALDYGYGPQSPFGKLVEADGKVLMLGAPRDTMTLLHHAEHLARIPGKRVLRYEAPMRGADGAVEWRWFEEFDTGIPVVSRLRDDYFADVVTSFLTAGSGALGKVGDADCVLVEARPMVAFAVDWLEQRFG